MTRFLMMSWRRIKAMRKGSVTKGSLALPPARRFAILTCMDARLDPAKFAGLAEGDAHVIRNAGGRATDDTIRSLIISHKLLGTNEWFVIHHTDCGMETFTDAHPCRLGWQTGERVAGRACLYHRTLLRSFDSPPRHHQEPWSWGRLPEFDG
jgi:carbonic anhydrase